MRMRKLVLPAVIALAAVAAAAQTNGTPEEFTAVAIANNNLQSGAGTVLISDDRWSSNAERNRLVTSLREKGSDALALFRFDRRIQIQLDQHVLLRVAPAEIA